jgi:aldehyde dehydrogenase (NAD+)
MQNVETIFINGEFVTPHGTEMMAVYNPSNNEVIAHVRLADETDTQHAVAAAKEAWQTYSKSSLETRAMYFDKIINAIESKLEDLVEITMKEYGASRFFCEYIIKDGIKSFRIAKELLKEENFVKKINEDTTVMLEPIGVAGLISPWNGSIWFMCVKSSAALAAGCTVVMKPSEMAALENMALAECFAAAQLPPGIINVLNGRGDVVGSEITRHRDISKISFTGSTVVGKAIARGAVDTMKRVTLELGGKAPSIILEDADLAKAIPFVLGVGFINSGQACIAGTRILVPESRLEEIKAALKEAVKNFKVGPPEENAAIGPMVSVKQYDRVQGYIKKGIEEGAEILVGGEGHPKGLEAGNFVKPTIFVNVKNDMTIAREEIFGPVLSVIAYKDEAEAIQIANDTVYGLHAYIAGDDITNAEKVARQIFAGRVMINALFDDSIAPFGGYKQSGIGREFGLYGLQSFLEAKSVFGKGA